MIVQSLEKIPSPTTAHPTCLVLAIRMSRLPVQEEFHLSVHVAPPIVPLLAALPSPVHANPIPSEVSPSTHATRSFFPLFFLFLFAFVRSSCHAIASLPLFP